MENKMVRNNCRYFCSTHYRFHFIHDITLGKAKMHIFCRLRNFLEPVTHEILYFQLTITIQVCTLLDLLQYQKELQTFYFHLSSLSPQPLGWPLRRVSLRTLWHHSHQCQQPCAQDLSNPHSQHYNDYQIKELSPILLNYIIWWTFSIIPPFLLKPRVSRTSPSIQAKFIAD